MNLPHSLRGRIQAALFAIAMVFVATTARADEAEGISVLGTGEVRSLPNQVEIALQAAASAELAGDAIVKYRDSLRRTTAAFETLKMANLEVKPLQLSYSQMSASANNMNAAVRVGGVAPAAKGQVQIARGVQLVLGDIGKLSEEELMENIAKLLDTAKDAGALSGGNENAQLARIMVSSGMSMNTPAVQFVLTDVEKHRESAYAKAFASAQANAGRLAKLSGVRLGRVLSVTEVPVATPESDSPENIQMKMISTIYGAAAGKSAPAQTSTTEIRSDKYGEIPVRVGLQVRFAIDGAGQH